MPIFENVSFFIPQTLPLKKDTICANGQRSLKYRCKNKGHAGFWTARETIPLKFSILCLFLKVLVMLILEIDKVLLMPWP